MSSPFDPAANLPASLISSALSDAPLTWWRAVPPDALDLTAQKHLRATLLATPALPLSGWEAAIQADPPAAIGVAITVLAEGIVRPGCLDRALSPVLLCAALGNEACRDVLVHALGRRARRRADLNALRLARAWRGRGDGDASFLAAPGR